MHIEALLFDLGKVIVDFDFEIGMKRFAAHCPLPRGAFEDIIWNKHWIRRYERGEISTADYHQYLCDASGLAMTLPEFQAAWSSVFLPDLIVPEQLLSTLNTRYPMIAVSNTNQAHADYISRNYRVFQYFHHKILSHEVGSLKPDRRIYDAAIEASGRPPASLFFADDRAENVEAAQALGIQAHLFESVPGLLAALRGHGVDVGDFAP